MIDIYYCGVRAAGAAGAAGGADMGKLEECLHALIFYYGVWYHTTYDNILPPSSMDGVIPPESQNG